MLIFELFSLTIRKGFFLTCLKVERVMLLSFWPKKENLNTTLKGIKISRGSGYKFLGLLIDETLKIDVNLNQVWTKVSQSIYVIRRDSSMVSDNVLHSLYCVVIFSRITYAVFWMAICLSLALKCLKTLVKKSVSMQSIPLNKSDAIFFNTTRLVNILLYVKSLKLYVMVNI